MTRTVTTRYDVAEHLRTPEEMTFTVRRLEMDRSPSAHIVRMKQSGLKK